MLHNQKGIAHLLLIVFVVLGIGVGLFLIKNPAIFNPKAAFEATDSYNHEGFSTGGYGSPISVGLTASPNPCILGANGLCTSKITWDSKYADLKISIRENPGSLFAQAAYGSQDAPWIGAGGATFDAYSGNNLVGTVFVKGVSSSSSIPCTIQVGSPLEDRRYENKYSCPSGYYCEGRINEANIKSGFCQPYPAISDKLSSRLHQLVDASLNGTLPASFEEQNKMLGLVPTGGGSLSRTVDGKIVVDVRLQDTSSSIQAELTRAGGEILSVSPEYRNITLGISINQLNNLANIQAVEAVVEIIRPFHGSPTY